MAHNSFGSMMNRPFRTAGALALICGGVLSLCTPAAMSQEDVAKNGRELVGGFDQPLHDGFPANANVTMLFSKSEQGRNYELKMEGGKLTGKVDGETLPPERVRRTGSKVELLGEDGEVLTEFGVGMGGLGDRPRGGNGWRLDRPIPRMPGTATIEVPRQAAPPPVMLGITMSEWGEGEGVEVDSVVEGLPASKAGVQEGDIIKSLNGKKVNSREELMDVLRTLKAGEAVEIVVARDGKNETLKVEPAAFDRERLGLGTTAPEDALAERLMERWGAQGQEWYDEAVKQLTESMEEIKGSKELGEAKGHADEALKQALEALKQAREAMGESTQLWLEGVPGRGGQTIITPREGRGGGGPDVMTLRRGDPFQPGVAAGPDVSRQMERLAEQLERLNERLDRIEERLPKQDEKKN